MPEQTYHYTALLEGGTVLYAEHFEDQSEAEKRSRQFAMAATEGQSVYLGTEPSDEIRKASKLTAPEVDDSQECRPLPDWAIAQHEVEMAEQAMIEATANIEIARNSYEKAKKELLPFWPAIKPDAFDSALESLMQFYNQQCSILGEKKADIAMPLRMEVVSAIHAKNMLDNAKAFFSICENDLAAKKSHYEEIKPNA